MNLEKVSDALFDLRDVRNVLSKKILNQSKDNDGSEFTVGDCLDNAIEFVEAIGEQVNYQTALEIYEEQGQSGVYDAVNDGTLWHDSWHRCTPCEDDTPHYKSTCLVCGTFNLKEGV
jgi:hypothetical protein